MPISLSDPRLLLSISGPQFSSPELIEKALHLKWYSGPLVSGREAPARSLHVGAAEAGPAGTLAHLPAASCGWLPSPSGRGGELLRHYWLQAAPPSPSAGQHVQAGKRAGFKFENPGDRGGVGQGTELQCAGAGGGGTDPAPMLEGPCPRQPAICPRMAPLGFSFLLWRRGIVSWRRLLTCREANVAMRLSVGYHFPKPGHTLEAGELAC